MKYWALWLLMTSYVNTVAQSVTFHAADDFIKVPKGSTVNINSDTAYVVSPSRIKYINRQLDGLDSIHTLYNDLVDNRNVLFNELKKASKAVKRLESLMQSDSARLNSDITEILSGLETTLTELRQNNEVLKSNNELLEKKTMQLEGLVKELRKETRGIWWNGLLDKAVVFAGGIGIGLLIAAL